MTWCKKIRGQGRKLQWHFMNAPGSQYSYGVVDGQEILKEELNVIIKEDLLCIKNMNSSGVCENDKGMAAKPTLHNTVINRYNKLIA